MQKIVKNIQKNAKNFMLYNKMHIYNLKKDVDDYTSAK